MNELEEKSQKFLVLGGKSMDCGIKSHFFNLPVQNTLHSYFFNLILRTDKLARTGAKINGKTKLRYLTTAPEKFTV
jgi:hypothetical protein